MKSTITFAAAFIALHASAQLAPVLIKAEKHPMQYYLSLPQGWSAAKTWPVILILESASKEYKKNAERFVAARGTRPFILVAPFNTNNSNYGRRDPAIFPYSPETWDYMEKIGDCQFNDDGILAVLKEVSEKYRGESKVFITGFEAGTHVLWSMVFNHTELLKAAAPVAGNFRRRCVEQGKISNDPSKIKLPIRWFEGSKDKDDATSTILYEQWKDAKALAQSAGFENLSEETVSSKGHEPMPDEVVAYFLGLIKEK